MEWVFQRLPRGRTVLHCLRETQEHLVRPLVNLGRYTVDVQDRAANTPLHVAAVDGETAVLRMLVMCSADPSLRNRAGRDALNCAVRSKANTLVRPGRSPRTAFPARSSMSCAPVKWGISQCAHFRFAQASYTAHNCHPARVHLARVCPRTCR